MIDIEFLKFVLPHYIKDEVLPDGSNAQGVVGALMAEVMQCSKERCDSSALLQDNSSEVNQARAAIRDFLAVNSSEGGVISRITIREEDREQGS